MPVIHSLFQMVEALEKKWSNPPSEVTKGARTESWRPLSDDYKDWTPLEESWEMPALLRNVRNNTEMVKPLSDAPAAAPVPAHPHERSSKTLGQGAEFSYTGTPATGTELNFGDDRKASVSAAEYASLRADFRGMQVAIGASRTNPPIGSLGAWLKENLSNLPAIASYVAPILIDAGWARKIDKRTIEFL